MAFIGINKKSIEVTIIDPATTTISQLKADGFLNGVLEINKNCSSCKCQNQNVIWIADIYIPPDRRRTGKAKELLNTLIDWAKKNEIHKLCGEITPHPNGPNENELKEIFKRLGCDIYRSNACYEIIHEATVELK